VRPVLFELVGEPIALAAFLRGGHRSHSSVAVRHGSDGPNVDDVTELIKQEGKMKFVLLIYQGSTPLPGSDRWQALSEAEQKAIYTDYAEVNEGGAVEIRPAEKYW
jgi:hypothetical protein